MTLSSRLHRLHGFFTQGYPLLIDRVTQLHNRLKPFPGHPLGPLSPGVHIDERRPVPVPCHDTPATFNWLVLAVGRRVRQPLHRLANGLDKRHHTVEKWRAPATALRAVVHCDVDRLGVRVLLCIPGVPPRCEGIDHTVAGVVRTATAQAELTTRFIHDATRSLLLLAPQGMLTSLVRSSCQTATGALPAVPRGCTIQAQALDTL